MRDNMEKVFFENEDVSKLSAMKVEGFNTESKIFRYEDYVLKYFNCEVNKYCKDRILTELDKCRKDIIEYLPEIVMPEFFFYFNEVFRGYLMKFIDGRTLNSILKDDSVSFDKKREYLIKLGEFLEKLDNVRNVNNKLNTLYLNDLHANNVIVTLDSGLRILEPDSMSFKGVDNFPAYYLEVPYGSKLLKLDNKYKIGYNSFLLSENIEYEEMRPNRESDMYCYIMMVLEFICGKDIHMKGYDVYKGIIKDLRGKGLPIELYEIFMNIYSEESNQNPYRLLKKIENSILL